MFFRHGRKAGRADGQAESKSAKHDGKKTKNATHAAFTF
jgi:hypothetical protein